VSVASAALAAGTIFACHASASAASTSSCGASSAIRADLDGNGTRERIQLRVRADGGRCDGVLETTIGSTRIAERIVLPKGAASGTLALAGARGVNAAPGAELIVRVWRGASTDFFRIYTVADGAFAALRVPGTSTPTVDAFPFGGALGSDDTVTCAGSGFVIRSAASLAAGRWTVHRTWYRASATAFSRSRSVIVKVSRLTDLREFRIDVPFATCR
jgi:hypothetical protein